MADAIKFLLAEEQIPRSWYNIMADLPSPPPPPLHPGTLKPLGPDDLAPLFPMTLIMQEVSADREIEIPGPVREIYRHGVRVRSIAPAVWRRFSIPRQRSTTNMRA